MSAPEREAAGAPAAADPSFREAMAEIEAILHRIEGEEIDIDDLADALRRAAHLLEVARGKIRRAEIEVSQIVQSLDAEPAGTAESAEPVEGAGEEPGDGDDGNRLF